MALFRALAFGGLFAGLVLALTACPRGQQGPPGGGMGMGGPPPVAVILEPVQQIDYAPAIELVGEVRATQRVTLAAEVGGRVTRIAHRVGEAHGRNSGTLIQIDTASYQAALDGANAGLAQAEENLSRMRSGPRQQEIAAQEAMVASARAQYEQVLDNLERQRKLWEQDVAPESAVVAAEKQADAMKAALESQQQVLDRLLEGNRPEDIRAAEAAVDAAQSRVDAAKLALSRTSITVPFDAVVAGLMVEIGAFVGPGTPVAEVVSDAPCEVWFNLPEAELESIGPGAVVEVTFDALPDTMISGEVISLSPAADSESRQFPVRVKLEDDRPRAGMAAYGRLLTEEARPVLAVKRDAVTLTNLGEAVYIMIPAFPDDEPLMPDTPPPPRTSMVLVTTGAAVGDLVVVEGNLQPGMMVVTRGNESLYDTAKIIPTNMMDPAGGGGAPPGAPGAEGMPPGEMPSGDAAAGGAGAGESAAGAGQ